ncbi:MAG TPA: Flp pilus assembly protein CpaB [Pirellulaceae bacterium]|nr:Flp pilus assembly protein CpaB [Pirellulaceae bacterium]
MKRISPATVTFGVMAIVLGLVAAYVVRQALQKPPVVEKPVPPPPAPEVQYLVFAKNVIPKNTRLTAADLFMGAVPKTEKKPEGMFHGINLVEGRITKETIAPGKIIREQNLLGLDESLPDLSNRLPEGHRAVTIIVQGADTGGKRLGEGDHIDIALTVEGSHPDLGEVMTRTLMHNVLIVDAAASRPLMRGTRRTTDLNGSSITVAVTPVDANKLIVAQRTGILQATLVSAKDNAPIGASADPVSRRQLLGLKEIVPPKKYTVEKWSGNSVQILEMSNDRIRESREISAGRREVPVSQPIPAPANDQVGRIPTGVKVPDVAYELGEEPLAALAPVAPEGAKEVK